MALSAPPRGLLLAYPARALLVVAGIPGAGKSTLLRRLFPGSSPAAAVLDTERIAVRWRHLPVPYRWYRPLVHTTHYLRAAVAIWHAPGAVVLHETGTRRIVRRLLAWLAAWAGRPAYLLVIEAGLEEARHGQRRRGRELRREPMLRHWRRWRRLRDRLAADPGGLRSEGYRRAIVLTRADAARVDGIRFTERSPDEHQA